MAAMVRTGVRASAIISELDRGMEFKVISACFNDASGWPDDFVSLSL